MDTISIWHSSLLCLPNPKKKGKEVSVGVGVLYSIHFNSSGQLFFSSSEAETEFSPLQRQIIPDDYLPTLIHNFDGISRYSVNSAKAFYFSVKRCWSFLILGTVFSISSWIVAKQSQEPHSMKFLQLCPSEIKRHSSSLLIPIWQWTRKYDNEQRESLDSLNCWQNFSHSSTLSLLPRGQKLPNYHL